MEAQRHYWNGIAGMYRAITRIDADDFHYGPLLAGERTLRLLPPLRPGMDALELGCGEGQNSIWLARRGLRCTAIDISEAQLAYARADARAAGLAVAFHRAAIEDYDAPEASFDLVTSSHAFEFLDDPFAQLARVARWLRPGGTLVLSTVHPVYNGEWVSLENDDGTETWGRFLPNYFHPVADVREQPDGHGDPIASRAWPISAWFNAIRAAGLALQRLEEPPASPDPAYASDDWLAAFDECAAIPTTLILVARKPASPPAP